MFRRIKNSKNVGVKSRVGYLISKFFFQSITHEIPGIPLPNGSMGLISHLRVPGQYLNPKYLASMFLWCYSIDLELPKMAQEELFNCPMLTLCSNVIWKSNFPVCSSHLDHIYFVLYQCFYGVNSYGVNLKSPSFGAYEVTKIAQEEFILSQIALQLPRKIF